MFSTKASIDERVASVSSWYSFTDVEDSLLAIGVCFSVFHVNLYPLTIIHTVPDGRRRRDLEDVGPMERLLLKIWACNVVDWFIR